MGSNEVWHRGKNGVGGCRSHTHTGPFVNLFLHFRNIGYKGGSGTKQVSWSQKNSRQDVKKMIYREAQGLHQDSLKRTEEQGWKQHHAGDKTGDHRAMDPKEGRLGWTSALACVSGTVQRTWNESSFGRKTSPLMTPHCTLQGRLSSSISKEYVWFWGRDLRHYPCPYSAPNSSGCVGAVMLRLWEDSPQGGLRFLFFYSYLQEPNTHLSLAVSWAQAHVVQIAYTPMKTSGMWWRKGWLWSETDRGLDMISG